MKRPREERREEIWGGGRGQGVGLGRGPVVGAGPSRMVCQIQRTGEDGRPDSGHQRLAGYQKHLGEFGVGS